ncbi:MAG: hypothetical protein V3U75_13020 [Methylococcaceae bacterium]
MNNIESFLNQFKVYDVGLTKIRIGNNGDGGYVALKELCAKTDTVYSFGIGGDVGFELDFVNRFPNAQEIQLCDPTIDLLPDCHPRFSFSREGISPGYGVLKNIAENSLLKVDVEWAEWEAFEIFSKQDVGKFSQILIELHIVHAEPKEWLSPYFKGFYQAVFDKINDDLFARYCEVLRRLNEQFYIFHIHPNNSLPLINVGGHTFSPLLEVSFVRKDLAGAVYSTDEHFPIEGLDFPNKTDRMDILGWWPLGG